MLAHLALYGAEDVCPEQPVGASALFVLVLVDTAVDTYNALTNEIEKRQSLGLLAVPIGHTDDARDTVACKRIGHTGVLQACQTQLALSFAEPFLFLNIFQECRDVLVGRFL
jgi:hypothetical protein